MILETMMGAGLGMSLRAVYMSNLFEPLPAARYVATLPLIALAASLAAVIAEAVYQRIAPGRRRTRFRERAFGSSVFFSTVAFIEFGKISAEWSAAMQLVGWIAAPIVCVCLSLLWANYCRWNRLASSSVAAQARARYHVSAKPFFGQTGQIKGRNDTSSRRRAAHSRRRRPYGCGRRQPARAV